MNTDNNGWISVDAARKLRGYFGKNDASIFEHWAYAYFDRIVKQSDEELLKKQFTEGEGNLQQCNILRFLEQMLKEETEIVVTPEHNETVKTNRRFAIMGVIDMIKEAAQIYLKEHPESIPQPPIK